MCNILGIHWIYPPYIKLFTLISLDASVLHTEFTYWVIGRYWENIRNMTKCVTIYWVNRVNFGMHLEHSLSYILAIWIFEWAIFHICATSWASLEYILRILWWGRRPKWGGVSLGRDRVKTRSCVRVGMVRSLPAQRLLSS